MQGITIADLYEQLSHLHEVEFIYDDITYMIQPELKYEKSWLVIWDCSDNPVCISRREIPDEGDIPKDIIDSILSEKCFNGKSFMEIEDDVTVTVIY